MLKFLHYYETVSRICSLVWDMNHWENKVWILIHIIGKFCMNEFPLVSTKMPLLLEYCSRESSSIFPVLSDCRISFYLASYWMLKAFFWIFELKYNLPSLSFTFQTIGKGSLWCVDPDYRPNLLQALRKTPYHPYHQLQMLANPPPSQQHHFPLYG